MKKVFLVLIIISAVGLVFFGAFSLLKSSVDSVGASNGTEESSSPEETEKAPPLLVPFNGSVEKNQAGEAVFTADLQDFINSVNSVYMQENPEPLLSPKEEWVHFRDNTPYSGTLSLCYRFSPNPENISEPTISVFVPQDKKGFYEIKLTYDEHGNQRHLYDKYKEICLWVLQALLPDLSAAQREELYGKLNLMSMENFRGGAEFYSQAQPPAEELITFGSMGFYGYYGGGTANICCVAVAENE